MRGRTLVDGPRAEPDGSFLRADCSDDRIHDLQGEPGTVLDPAAILVSTLVRHVLDELIDEVARRSVHFDTVEAGLNRVPGCAGVPADVLLDFCGGRRCECATS